MPQVQTDVSGILEALPVLQDVAEGGEMRPPHIDDETSELGFRILAALINLIAVAFAISGKEIIAAFGLGG